MLHSAVGGGITGKAATGSEAVGQMLVPDEILAVPGNFCSRSYLSRLGEQQMVDDRNEN